MTAAPAVRPTPVKGVDPDLTRWRDETPGCVHRNHLNNAGAALMPEPVIRAVGDHLDLEAHIGG
jgi:hypothetical protein